MSNMVGPTSPLLYYYHPDRRPFEKLPLAKGKNIFYFNPNDKNFSGVVDIKDGGFDMPEVSHRYYQYIPPSPKTMAKNKEIAKEEPKRKPTDHELRDPVKKEKPKPKILPKPDFSMKNAKSSLDQERRPRFIKFSPQGKATDTTADYVEIQQPNDESFVAESPIVATRRNITHSLPEDFGDKLFNEDEDSDVISTCSSVSALSEEENVLPYKPHLNDDVFGPGLNMREIKPPCSTTEREKVFKQRGSSDTFLVSSISYSVSSSEAEEEEDEGKKGPPNINQEETSNFKSTRVFQRQDALSSSEVGKTDSEGPEDVRYAVLKFQDFSDIENYNSEGNDSGFVRKIARLSNSMSDLTSIDSSFDKSIEDEEKISTIERRDSDEKEEISKKKDENSFLHCPYCSLEDENTCESGIGHKNTKLSEQRKHNAKGLLKTVDRDTNKMKQKPETRNMVSEETIRADILSIQKTDREFKFDEPVKEKLDVSSRRKENMINKKNHLMDKVIDVNKNDIYGELRVDINFDDDIDGGIRYDKKPYKTDKQLDIVGEITEPLSVDIDVSSSVNKMDNDAQKGTKNIDKPSKLKYVKEKEKRPRMIFQDTFDLSTSEDGAEKSKELEKKSKELEKTTKIGDIVIATKDVVLNVNYPSEKKQASVKRNNSFESNEDIRKWIQDQIKHFKTIQIELDESSDEKSKTYVEKVNQRRQKGNNIKKKTKFFETKEKEDKECELEDPGAESNDLEKMMFIKEYVQNIIEDMLRKKKDEEEKEKIEKEELEKRRKDGVKSEAESNDVEKLEFIKEYVRGIVENVVVERRKDLMLNKIDLEKPKKPVEEPFSLENQLKKADDTKDDIIKLNVIGQYIQDLIDNVIKTRWDELSKNVATDVIGEVIDDLVKTKANDDNSTTKNVIDDLVKTKAGDDDSTTEIELVKLKDLPFRTVEPIASDEIKVIDDLIKTKAYDDNSTTKNELLKLKDVPFRTIEPIASDEIKEVTLDKSSYVPTNINIRDTGQNDNSNAMVIPCVNPTVEIHIIKDEKDNKIKQKTGEDKELIVEEIKDVITLEKTFNENDDLLRKLDEADDEEKRKAEEESIDRNAVNEYVRNLINDVINDRYNEICDQQVADIALSDDYHGDESNNETDLDDLSSLSVGKKNEDFPDGLENKKAVDDDGTYFHFMDTENDGNDTDKEQYFFESEDEAKNDQAQDDKINAKNEESGIDTKSEDLYLDDNTIPNDGLFIRNIDTGEVIPINEIKEEKLMDQNLSRSDVILDLTTISDDEQKGKGEDLNVDLDVVSSPKTLMQEMIDLDLPLLQSEETNDPEKRADSPKNVVQPPSHKRPKVNRKSLYRKLSATFYNPCEDIFRQAEVMADAMERYRGFKHIHDDSRTYENIVRWKDELIESFHKRNFGIL